MVTTSGRLSVGQLQAMKDDIAIDPVMSLLPNTSDGNFEIAALYNEPASPLFYVWNSRVNINDIYDAIIWANFTPIDVPDNSQVWANRSLACQGKQFNLQTMLLGKSVIDATRPQIRVGLQDALTALPSGVSGVNRSAGWIGVQLILSRMTTRGEKLLATGTGTQASPGLAGFEGIFTYQDVEAARNLL